MLQKVLEEAEEQHSLIHTHLNINNDVTPGHSPEQQDDEDTTTYGAISNTTTNERTESVSEMDDADFSEDSSSRVWEIDEGSEPNNHNNINSTEPTTGLTKTWNWIKSVFIFIANVDNLWDNDDDNDDIMNDQRIRTRRDDPLHTHHTSRRNWSSKLRVLFWFVVLATSYSGERSTFKLLVDRAGPFRLFAIQMVTGIHATLLGVMLLVQCFNNNNKEDGSGGWWRLGIPFTDVGLMAVLDSVSLLLVFLSGSHVPPTLTVILVQFTIPLSALLSQLVHPYGRCSLCRPPPRSTTTSTITEGDNPQNGDHGRWGEDLSFSWPQEYGGLTSAHVWGSSITTLAVALALVPATVCIFHPDWFDYADTIPLRTSYNTFVYVSSCLPAALSQLYKEHVFWQHAQAVPATWLNFLLSICQFAFCAVVAPLVYSWQGLGDVRHDDPYPSTDLTQNFLDGFYCFFRILNDGDQLDKYSEAARCDFTFGLAIFHCLGIILVGVAVDKIVQAGATKIMYRGISAGIILAVVTMYVYDLHIEEFSYGPIVDALNISCLVLVILGTEVYHRESLPASTFETTYPQVVYEEMS